MNKIKLLVFFCFSWVFVFSQNTDSTTTPAPSTQTSPEPQRKFPKGYQDYKNNKSGAKEKMDYMEKLYFGCNIALRYYGYNGASVVYYDVSPHVGYKFNDYVSAGLQILYNNSVLSQGSTSVSYNILGGGAFGRVLVFRSLFLQAEYDYLSVPSHYLGTAISERAWSDEKMAGLGYKSMWGSKLSYYFVLMFDFQPTFYSPYLNNPLVYRAGLVWNY